MSHTLNLSEWLNFALDLVRRASAEALARQRGILARYKEDGSVVTDADEAVQTLLRDTIAATYPHHGFLGEEDGGNTVEGKSIFWVADPIDGTNCYQRQLPAWAVSLALVVDGQPQVAVVSLPPQGQIFYATRGGGAFCDGYPIAVSPGAELTRHDLILISSNVHPIARPVTRARVHAYGSTCAHLLYTAAGRAQATLLGMSYPWDLVAAGLILEEAGGILVDMVGQRLNLGDVALSQTLVMAGVACHPDRVLAAFASLEVDPGLGDHAFGQRHS